MDLDLMDIKEFETFIMKRGCVKCRHQWFPRSANPQRCPRCQTWLDKRTDDVPVEETPSDKEQ
jgi:ssDNA-binding Zn-finger/Zn-ribbon topoisomerase 1